MKAIKTVASVIVLLVGLVFTTLAEGVITDAVTDKLVAWINS